MSSQPNMAMPYPVYPPHSSKSHFRSDSSLDLSPKRELIGERNISRTPSPTPSEYNALNGIKEEKTTRQKIQYYGIIAVLITLAVLISVFHEKIITALQPETNWLSEHKIGPIIPIAIFIVLSFPPLFGHELVAMLVGVTWDFPLACLIVAVGTLLGEIANYFTFKYACSARGAKYEAKDLSYGLLAHVVRHGGFLIVLVIRYSAIPPHFATTVFSTVGVSFVVFIGAAVLSLPKQLVPVYVGYAMKPSNTSSKSAVVEKVVLVISIAITIGAYVWINRQMTAARPEFIYARRKARQGKAGVSTAPQFISLPDVV
ncbi:hypothetical protein B0H17DRAFT_130803 [Mycena rosella]|uniref:Golgi apparatus membrane protein TVP38 n=1 Tax=Mycena rosella TaxID=1033263 RepID=A0AAD7D2K7_MYCRO|nr:hypothetical protein B0H17DRAFT_130803 [Mycena rosella]